ncbi:MAG: carbohydrate ABC transporter permease [Lachnospiraceae bacterium]|nr:carbohydrate ABC transporter permease [Lachnospiraceae bacterium]
MKHKISRFLHKKLPTAILFTFLLLVCLIFLIPTIFTFTNSFMSSSEIAANYGQIFQSVTGSSGDIYVSETVNLKLIPDRVSFSQYASVLLKNPGYLIKFWNSCILVLPIVIFQILVALLASYGFARYKGKARNALFFAYIIIMLMPYQVTLVPNRLVADWLSIYDTRWAIILPGIFSPFAVFLLTKYMRRIPSSLIESAKLDGAGELKIFARICAPMASGISISVAILIFIDYWNMVEQPLILLTDPEVQPLSVFLSKINEGDAGLAFAIATIYMCIPIAIFLYCEDYLIEGVSYQGGIKG